jgi:hypothetical protein
MGPVGLDRAERNAQVLRDFRIGHAGEESKDDDFGRPSVDGLEARQRGFEGEQILDWHSGRGCSFEQFIQLEGRDSSASLVTISMTAMIDEEPAHGLGGEREPVRPSLPLDDPFFLQLQPGLVHERRRLQRVIAALSAQVAARDTTQFPVDHREELTRWGGASGRHA